MNPPKALLSLGLWDNSFTEGVPGAADRRDIGRSRPSKSEGRRTHPQQSPNDCQGQPSPYLARLCPWILDVNMEPQLSYVGIDVAKDRVDVAMRPSGRVGNIT